MYYLSILEKNEIYKIHYLSKRIAQFLEEKWIDGNQKIWVIGAKNLIGELIGVIVAFPKNNFIGMISNIVINKRYKNLGIEKALLQKIEEILKKKNFSKIEMKLWYSTEGKKSYQKFLKILKELSWEEFQKIYTSFIIKLDFEKVKTLKWFPLGDQSKLNSKYELFLWKNLTKKEEKFLKEIKKNLEGKIYYLDPLEVKGYHKNTSWGVRDKVKSKVLGWLITEKTDEDVLLLRRLFILPEYRGKKIWTAFLFRKCIESSVKEFKYFWFNVLPSNERVKKKFEFYLAPLIERKVVWYHCSKTIR